MQNPGNNFLCILTQGCFADFLLQVWALICSCCLFRLWLLAFGFLQCVCRGILPSRIRPYRTTFLEVENFRPQAALVFEWYLSYFVLGTFSRCAVLVMVKMALCVFFGNQFDQKWLQRFILTLTFHVISCEIAYCYKYVHLDAFCIGISLDNCTDVNHNINS